MIRKNSGDARSVCADVGKMVDVKRMVDACFKQFHRLAIILSNAAAHVAGIATEISEDDWDRTHAVCLKATWMIPSALCPAFLGPH